MILTRLQREALKKVFDRGQTNGSPNRGQAWQGSYREFRRTVRPEICGFGAVMVPWCGMWLGIEPDGHTHS
ncbi:hypothetical protein LCGC14_2751450 [marine sediment metagenome]|uniref:Uncharacterized protein n=1 Tax=marine sediment metagenome TaxID=412755 RepID=A0A0F8ZNP1_9ZZZZ